MTPPFAAPAALPAWWHPLPSDLPRRLAVPSALDQAQKLGGLVDIREMFRIAHRVMRSVTR